MLNTKPGIQGFTLMELLIVIAILGILVTVGIGSFMASQTKSRDLARKSNLKSISNALELYYNDHGQYPASMTDGDGNAGAIGGCGTTATPAVCEWGDNWTQDSTTVYMAILPKDPKGDRRYYYVTSASNTSYKLYARLDNLKDGDLNFDGSGEVEDYAGIPCGNTVNCNYGISSSNISMESAL